MTNTQYSTGLSWTYKPLRIVSNVDSDSVVLHGA